ncbi:MAG: hypothetical protein L3J46_05750 [Kangiellaceae bacterium]|nr:hypothetical protein [Kangiellaceae bacterium]
MSAFKKVEKLGRQAWLANLGAYGTAWKYAVEKLDETYTKTNALMSELVSEGEKLEVDLQDKLKARFVLDSKINALKDKLGLNEASDATRLAELDSKVDDLISAVTKLTEKPVAKKTTRKKVASKKA